METEDISAAASHELSFVEIRVAKGKQHKYCYYHLANINVRVFLAPQALVVPPDRQTEKNGGAYLSALAVTFRDLQVSITKDTNAAVGQAPVVATASPQQVV